jgi:hypothetical protein
MLPVKMNRHSCFLILAITSLVVLLSSAGCILTASTQETASTTDMSNIANTAPNTEVDIEPVTGTDTPPDNAAVGSDPVTGQSEEINMRWEQLCLSSEYQVQIAKDPGFTVIVLDTGSFAPASSVSPGVYYPAGGRATSPSSVTKWANLEAGHTYYWRARVRQAATGQQMLSPWSEVASFTVKSGFPTGSTSYGIQPLQPSNGCNSCPVKSVSFSWTPLSNTTKYSFVLASDADMTEVVKDAAVTTTAYEYDGELEYSQVYFWRVMALEPTPSDWSAIFIFHTEAAPPSQATKPEPEPTPLWVWPIISFGIIVLIVLIVILFNKYRK